MHITTIIILVILLLILWAMIEQELLIISRYTVKSDKLAKALDHTRFVVLADLHNMTFGVNNKRLVKKIEKLSPEFILIAGDIIDKQVTSYPSRASVLLQQLAGKYKIYYAYGNHEQKLELYGQGVWPQSMIGLSVSWERFKESFKKLNVEFLNNTDTVWEKNGAKLHISGVSIEQRYFERHDIKVMEEGYLHSLLGKSDNENYHILIAHNPVYFYDYANWGADLTISGHLHGGMVRIPGVGGVISPQVKFFPKYHSGNFTENGQEMIVSRGLGTHSHMPRLFNIPEIVLVELTTTKQ